MAHDRVLPRAITLTVLSAVGFGGLGILGQFAFERGLSTANLLFWRFLIAGIAISCVARAMPRGPIVLRYALISLALGAIGYAGQAYLYFTAVKLVGVGLSALLLYLAPAFVALLARLFDKEPLSPIRCIALGAAFIGTALLLVKGNVSLDVVGVLCGVGSAAWYAGYLFLSGRVSGRLPHAVATAFVAAGASLSFLLLSSVTGGLSIPSDFEVWAILGAIALVGTAIPIAFLFEGMRVLGATRAVLLSTLEPVVAVVLGILVLNEPLTWMSGLGAALVLAGATLIQFERRGRGARP